MVDRLWNPVTSTQQKLKELACKLETFEEKVSGDLAKIDGGSRPGSPCSFFPLILLRISRTSIGNGRQRYAGSGSLLPKIVSILTILTG